MERYFICYRREDADEAAHRIYEWIAARVTPNNVFIDVDKIDPGLDFRMAIEQALSRTSTVLVIISTSWLDMRDADGNRRLDNVQDPVRLEIEYALGHRIRVVPVLLHGTTMPNEKQLPSSLSQLAYRNGVTVRLGRDFQQDMSRIIRRGSLSRRTLLTGIGGVGALIGVASLGAWQIASQLRNQPGATPTETSAISTLTTTPTSAWQEASGALTDTSPAVTTFAGRLFMFLHTGDDHIQFNSTEQGLSFSASQWQTMPPGTSDRAPAITVFNDRLYVFVKGVVNQLIYFNSQLQGGQFATQWSFIPPPFSTNQAPSVCVFGTRLYVFVKGGDDQLTYYLSAPQDQPFDGNSARPIPPLVSNTSPAAIAFENRLYVFIKGRDDLQIHFSSATQREDFSPWLQVPGGPITDASPAVAVLNGRIYLFVKGRDDLRLHYTSMGTDQTFAAWQQLPEGPTPDSAPSATTLGDKVVVAVKIASQRISFGSFSIAPQ